MVQYHVSLNGNGYLVDLSRYERRVARAFAPKTAQGDRSFGDQLIEQVWASTDWSGGEGFVAADAAAGGWRRGSGIDTYTERGTLRLGPELASVAPGSAPSEFTVAQAFKGNLYVGDGAGTVWKWDGTSWATSDATGKAGGIRALATAFGRLFASNGTDGVVRQTGDGAGWSTAFTLAGSSGIRAMAVHYRQAAQYLYLVGDLASGLPGAYFWDTGSLSLKQYEFEQNSIGAGATVGRVMAVLDNRLYFFIGDVGSRAMGVYSVDDATAGGNWRLHQLYPESYATCGAVFEGAVYLGMAHDGRIMRWDGSKLEEVFRLARPGSPYGFELRGAAVFGGALWFSVVEGGGVGLLRFDGRAWSRPAAGLAGTEGRGVASYAGRLHVLTQKAGDARVWRTTGNYGAAGTLETGLFDAGLPSVEKAGRSVTVLHGALGSGESVEVQYRLEDAGAWVSLGTSDVDGATSKTFGFSATFKQMALRVVLGGLAGSSSSPVVYGVLLRYALAPAVKREWEVPLVLEGTAELPQVTLDGEANPRTGAQMSGEVWAAKGVAGPVSYVDLDGAGYSVYFEELREEVAELSQRRGYQTVARCRLVEA